MVLLGQGNNAATLALPEPARRKPANPAPPSASPLTPDPSPEGRRGGPAPALQAPPAPAVAPGKPPPGASAPGRPEPTRKRILALRVEARRLDRAAALLLRSLLETAWESEARMVVLDLSEVVSIDSLGISALVAEQRRRPPGARITLCAPSEYVRDMLEVTTLFRVFDIFSDVEAARAALQVEPTAPD
ncbi:MAG TPA: STAS domain-containing protein [Polyangiaceae bacterium]|nr:STAS domain-containing protein [Polyangiaceae bacterium]